MKFLVDAQLPRRLAYRLREAGHDALHTLDLPLKNRTPDDALTTLARQEDRVLVTKDADFVHQRILTGYPRLLLVAVGNCTNAELEALLLLNLGAIVEASEAHAFVELTRTALVIHA